MKKFIKKTLAFTKQIVLICLRNITFPIVLWIIFPLLGLIIIFLPNYPWGGNEREQRFIFFFLNVLALWIGMNTSSISFIKDRENYIRERLQGLSVKCYYFGNLFGYFILAIIQSITMTAMFWFLMSPYGIRKLNKILFNNYGIENSAPLNLNLFPGLTGIFIALLLSATCGVILGLMISAWSKIERTALVLVPMVTIFMIVYSQVVVDKLPKSDIKWKPIKEYISSKENLWSLTSYEENNKQPKYFWGARLSLFNPLRYSMNAMKLGVFYHEKNDGKYDSADTQFNLIVAWLLETVMIFILMFPVILFTLYLLYDPRKRI